MSEKRKSRLNGVDLLSVAVLGILSRIFYYAYAALGILFPYNVGVLSAFMLFPGIIALTLVYKKGTFTVYTISWLIISFLFQGENVAWLLFAWIPIVVAELVRIPFTKQESQTLTSSLVIGLSYGLSYLIGMILYISLIVKAYFPVQTWAVVVIIGIVAGIVAAILGYYVGKALKKIVK